MKIGRYTLWMGAREAAANGATHYARIWGILPGYAATGTHFMWIPASDLLVPVEDGLNAFAGLVARVTGIEMNYSFSIGREIGDD